MSQMVGVSQAQAHNRLLTSYFQALTRSDSSGSVQTTMQTSTDTTSGTVFSSWIGRKLADTFASRRDRVTLKRCMTSCSSRGVKRQLQSYEKQEHNLHINKLNNVDVDYLAKGFALLATIQAAIAAIPVAKLIVCDLVAEAIV